MSKVLRCGDLMPGCRFEARGDNDEEVLIRTAEHARAEHGLSNMSAPLLDKVKRAIHEDD